MSQLDSNFIIELAKTCIVSKNILEIVKGNMQYSYLNNEPEKQIFKYIFDFHGANNKTPTVGLISQHVNSRDGLSVISKIAECNIYDKKDDILEKFEEFIRRARFIELHKESAELYEKGEHDKAIGVLANKSKEINEFSLKRKTYSRVYGGFDQWLHETQNQDFSATKVPTGIPQHDYFTRGGITKGTGLLIIARSGIGKSTVLRSLGHHASFRGIPVLHIASGDSTEKEIKDGYHAAWTGISLDDIRTNNLSSIDLKKIEKARQAYLAQAGEIYIKVFSQFHNASILDCRNFLIDLLKEVPIGLVLFDLLEGFDPGDGKRYNTGTDGIAARKKATSEKIINIATEFNIAVAAVTQASSIEKEHWNNPNFVITRNNISNLKSTLDPFADVITLNQTEDEDDNDIMRIHEEKNRHYKLKSWQSTYHIAQDRAKGRFIDVAETNKKFWNVETKQIIRNKAKKE